MVTAETAVVLPVLLAVTIALVWLVALGVSQVRLVDAARETARAVARDENRARAVDLGLRVAPPGSRITIDDDGSTVTVVARTEVTGIGGLFGFLPGARLDASAVAAKEQP